MLNHFLTEDRAVEWLLRFVIPLVNIESDISLRREFPLILKSENILMGLKYQFYLPGEKLAGKLTECKNFLKDVLFIALLQEKREGLFNELEEKIPAIEERIKRHFQEGQVSVSWKGFGDCYFATTNQVLNGELGAFEYLAVRSIMECLYSCRNEDEYPRTGKGFEKIGLCKNCWKVFEKKRRDQEYCSDRCKKAVQMRRYRKTKSL